MQQYKDLCRLVLDEGFARKDRTGTGTIGVFGAQAKFDLSKGFPLLTTKKVYAKAIIHELLWFLSGSTNIRVLEQAGVKIWTEWPHKAYNAGANPQITLEAFRQRIIDEDCFAQSYGNIGVGAYGAMWRSWPKALEAGEIDQFSEVMDRITKIPDDRRLIVTAWNPELVKQTLLPPCHCLFQFSTHELTDEERCTLAYNQDPLQFKHEGLDNMEIPTRQLDLQLYQRSCDLFLGVPFNIASYSLLLQMVAQVAGMKPGVFTHTYGDLHIYNNHREQIAEQLNRECRQLPEMRIAHRGQDIFGFHPADFDLVNYNPHAAIKGEVSV